MSAKYISIIILYILLYEVICDGKKNTNIEDDVFVATREWQVVKKGQKIPKGLHVRVNFESGITEAKLLDENEDKSKNQALTEVPQEEGYELDKLLYKKSVLELALKKIKSDEILKPDDIRKLKDQFRTYEELKKDLGDLNLTPKIDAEVLKDLISQYEEEIKKEKINLYEILRILEDLDFLAHQFDNAIEFVSQNGFNEIIYKNLNLTSPEIKHETLKLMSSLLQNNAKVQIHALETGSVVILLKILSLDSENAIKPVTVTALGCLLRRFPLAQLKFVENGGLSVISKLFQTDMIKVQVRLATLINDLLTENNHAIADNLSKNQQSLVGQYKLVNLESLLLEHNWCENLNKLLYTLVMTDENDHDSIEKCLLSMHVIVKKCGSMYKKDILHSLVQKYELLALNDVEKSDEFNNSDFFTNLKELCGELLKHTKSELKTEL